MTPSSPWMAQLLPGVVVATMLGSALVGGVFFAFSTFIMKALARLPSAQGAAAMQSINVVVLNPWFLGAFVGTAVLALAVGGLALTGLPGGWSSPPGLFFLAGALLYLVGTFLVTAFGNVPLNEALAAVSVTDPEGQELWNRYLDRWTWWNHLRTAAALAAALLLTLGLLRGGGA